MNAGKRSARSGNFADWPASLLSHDIWVPDETVDLGPLSGVRERGHEDSLAKSAVRSLDVLEMLGRAGKPLRAVEIAATLRLSPSSAHQLLKSMVDGAYLLFDPGSKRYWPSLRAAALGSSVGGFTLATQALQDLTATLLEKLGTTLTLSVSQARFMQIVDVNDPGPREHSADLRRNSVGLRVPIFGSCTGAAWLSAQDDETILAVARLCRRALGSQADDVEHLLEIAHRVRQQGYAFGGVSPDDSTRSIAAPLPADATGTVYVLAISDAAEEMSEHRAERAQILVEEIALHFPAS